LILSAWLRRGPVASISAGYPRRRYVRNTLHNE
jgi:hypothetical protein